MLEVHVRRLTIGTITQLIHILRSSTRSMCVNVPTVPIYTTLRRNKSEELVLLQFPLSSWMHFVGCYASTASIQVSSSIGIHHNMYSYRVPLHSSIQASEKCHNNYDENQWRTVRNACIALLFLFKLTISNTLIFTPDPLSTNRDAMYNCKDFVEIWLPPTSHRKPLQSMTGMMPNSFHSVNPSKTRSKRVLQCTSTQVSRRTRSPKLALIGLPY
jgi:hypothetical protein